MQFAQLTSTTDHLREVRRLLYPARRKWRDIGIELGLDINDLDTIKDSFGNDLTECLTAMIRAWLNSITYPLPTWRNLGHALKAKAVNEQELSRKGILAAK